MVLGASFLWPLLAAIGGILAALVVNVFNIFL